MNSSRSGTIWVKSAGGAEPPKKIATIDGTPTGWTPDGRALAVGREADIWLLPLDSNKPHVLVQSRFSEVDAQLSPDGRSVAYASDQSGQPDVYVEPVPATGEKWRVTPRGGIDPVWNQNGRELFYTSESDIYVVQVVNGRPVGSPNLVVRNAVSGGPIVAGGLARYAVSRDGSRIMSIVPRVSESSQLPLTVILNWPALLRR